MSEKIATFKDLDDIASLDEGTTSGYISGAISSNMCVSKRNFDIVSSKTIAAVGNGLILKDNSDSLEYDSDRLILKKDVQITKTKCTIILSGESKTYHNTAYVKCTASVDGKLYWGESESNMENPIEISAGVEVEVISRTSVGTTAIYAYFVPTNPIYPTLGGVGDPHASASAEITKANDAGISVTTYSKTYNGSAQEVAACTSSHGTSEWYVGYTTDPSSTDVTDVTWAEANENLTLTNAGTYYIWKKWKGDSNHNSHDGVKMDATVIISNATFTVSASNQTYTYNGSAQGAAITVSNLVGGQTATIKYGTTSGTYDTTTAPKITNANEDKTIYWQVTALNHATQTGSYTLTMNQRSVTVTAGGSRKEYDGNAYTYNRATLSGMVSGHTLNSYTCTGSITNVGSVDNIPSNAKIVDANSNDVTANYNITYVNGIITITQRPITFTATNQSKRYDGTALTAANTASVTSGSLVSGHIATFTCSGSRTTVGTSTKTLSDVKINSGTIDVTSNYSITKKNGTLTVSKATPTLTLTGVTKTYDGNIYYASAKASVAGTVYYGTTSGSMQYKISVSANRSVNLTSLGRTTAGTTTVYAYLVPSDSTNYNNSTNVSTIISIGQVPSTLSYTPEDINTYCLNSTSALVKSQIVECLGAQGGGRFDYDVVAYDQEGSIISGFDISKYYLWTIEEGEGVIKGIVTYRRNPMEMTLSDIVCIYLVDGQGVEEYIGLDNHRDVDEPWTHVANTSTDGENILKLAWSADGGEGIDEYTFGGELSDVPFDTFAISMPVGLSVGDYNIAITVKQADSNYAYDELTRIFVLSVLPDEHTGVFDGTLSMDSSARLSAGDDSRVITWGAVYTTWKYGGDKDYYPYPSHLRIECNNSTATQFVSIDNTTYSNSEQATTSVLTKQSFRDTALSMPTYKITLLSYNGSTVKSINVAASSNTSTLQSTRTEYGTPTITIGDTLTPGASSATVTCQVWNKEVSTYLWTSGYESEREGAATAGSAEWSIKSQTFVSKTALAGTGTIISRFSKSKNTLSHSTMGTNVGTDKVTLTAANADALLEGITTTGVDKTISVYNGKQHTLTRVDLSYTPINAGSTISTPTVTFDTSYTYFSGATGGTTTGNTWNDVAILNTEYTFTPIFSFSSSTTLATINTKTGVVTWRTTNTTTSPRNCYVTCSATMESEGLTTNVSSSLSAAVRQMGVGGGTTTGGTTITFINGGRNTYARYTISVNNDVITLPANFPSVGGTIGTQTVSSNNFTITVQSSNTGVNQRLLTVSCSNMLGVDVSLNPTIGTVPINGNGMGVVTLNVERTVLNASLTVTIKTS